MANIPAATLRTFVMYAHEDKPVRDKLLRQLRPLADNGDIDLWSDHEIKPGEHWDEAIRQRLAQSELILLLVSDDFFASDYIRNVELREALARHERGETRLLPIIARHCGWEDVSALARLQVLPPEGRPIVSRGWDSTDEPYRHVYDGVKTAIREVRLVIPPLAVIAPAPATTTILAPDMILVKGGRFRIGSETDDKDGNDFQRPAHPVTVPDFEMGKYTVTNKEFCQFLNDIASKITLNVNGEVILDSQVIFGLYGAGQKAGSLAGFAEQIEYDNGTIAGGEFSVKRGCEQYPVVLVTWYGATAYTAWLSEKTSLDYRLPSEAEWEYAARGGQQSRSLAQGEVDYKYAGSDDPNEVAWHDQNSAKRSHLVGEKKPNELGFYDLSGNVWELCEDYWHNTYAGHPRDGSAWLDGDRVYRVLRGGSWGNDIRNNRVAVRGSHLLSSRSIHVGFRLARTK